MQFILVSVMAGLLGTAGMTLFLWIVNRSGVANADMVRAVGSAATRSYATSLKPGLVIHFSLGIPFSMLYIFALSFVEFSAVYSVVFAAGIFGFVHGFVFSFVMVILAEHHPVEKFQEAGFQVAIVHLIAHVIFGLIIGIVVALSGNPLQP